MPAIVCVSLRLYDKVIGFQIMFLARLEGAPLSKAYNEYVVEGGRLIRQPKNFIWKTIFEHFVIVHLREKPIG